MRKPRKDTWSARAEELRSKGASEETVESVRRLTAPVRHKARVKATIEAAHNFAEDQLGEAAHEQYRRCAVGLIAVDLIGIGGREGATGDGTARLSGFQNLGSGRKRAGDGAAWMAAADCALSYICQMWQMEPVIGSRDGELVIEDTPICVPAEWRLAVALRALAKMEARYPVAFDDDDAGWCVVANQANEETASNEPPKEIEPRVPTESKGARDKAVACRVKEDQLDIIIDRPCAGSGLYTATSLDHPGVFGLGETKEIARKNLSSVIERGAVEE